MEGQPLCRRTPTERQIVKRRHRKLRTPRLWNLSSNIGFEWPRSGVLHTRVEIHFDRTAGETSETVQPSPVQDYKSGGVQRHHRHPPSTEPALTALSPRRKQVRLESGVVEVVEEQGRATRISSAATASPILPRCRGGNRRGGLSNAMATESAREQTFSCPCAQTVLLGKHARRKRQIWSKSCGQQPGKERRLVQTGGLTQVDHRNAKIVILHRLHREAERLKVSRISEVPLQPRPRLRPLGTSPVRSGMSRTTSLTQRRSPWCRGSCDHRGTEALLQCHRAAVKCHSPLPL